MTWPIALGFILLWGFAMLAPLFTKTGRTGSPTLDDHDRSNTLATTEKDTKP